MAHAWWPKDIPEEWIPAIRAMGKRGVCFRRTGSHPTYKMQTGCYEFTRGEYQSNEERTAIKTIANPLLAAVATVLANGVKLFVVPEDMIDDLNQIEIPIMVSDYAQPFPTVVVKSGDEYHFVMHLDGVVSCMETEKGILDTAHFFSPDAVMEDNLSDPYSTMNLDGREGMVRRNFSEVHRFRATLNYILLIMSGGFVVDRDKKAEKQYRKHSSPLLYTLPQMCKPQNINLWRKRVIDANHSGEGTGSSKSPHWRRAHWRHVAVGRGRAKRELRLIPCCFVNRERLHQGSDIGESEYMVEAK